MKLEVGQIWRDMFGNVRRIVSIEPPSTTLLQEHDWEKRNPGKPEPERDPYIWSRSIPKSKLVAHKNVCGHPDCGNGQHAIFERTCAGCGFDAWSCAAMFPTDPAGGSRWVTDRMRRHHVEECSQTIGQEIIALPPAAPTDHTSTHRLSPYMRSGGRPACMDCGSGGANLTEHACITPGSMLGMMRREIEAAKATEQSNARFVLPCAPAPPVANRPTGVGIVGLCGFAKR